MADGRLFPKLAGASNTMTPSSVTRNADCHPLSEMTYTPPIPASDRSSRTAPSQMAKEEHTAAAPWASPRVEVASMLVAKTELIGERTAWQQTRECTCASSLKASLWLTMSD